MPKIVRESSVTKARKDTSSFRTTIPREIAELLEVKHKDKIVWEIAWEVEAGEEIEVNVRRKEEK